MKITKSERLQASDGDRLFIQLDTGRCFSFKYDEAMAEINGEFAFKEMIRQQLLKETEEYRRVREAEYPDAEQVNLVDQEI